MGGSRLMPRECRHNIIRLLDSDITLYIAVCDSAAEEVFDFRFVPG